MINKLNFIDIKPRLDEHEVQRVLSLSLLQPSNPEVVFRVVERCRNNNERKLWGTIDGERILGVVEYYIRDSEVVYIANIAVSEESRGQGIGRFIIVTLQEKHKLPIELETDDDAIGFYRKCGFEIVPFEKHGVRRWKCTL